MVPLMYHLTILSGKFPQAAIDKLAYISTEKVTKAKKENPKKVNVTVSNKD